MGVKILKYALTVIVFCVPLVALLSHDNGLIGKMSIEEDSKYCADVHRDYLKNKCYKTYQIVKESKCIKIPHERLKSECLEELKKVDSNSSLGILNTAVFMFELFFLWIASRSIWGGYYWGKLEEWKNKPFIGKAITYYRDNQEYDSSIFIRIMLSTAATGVFVGLNYLIRSFVS